MIEDWGKIKVDENKVWKDSVEELRKQIILMNQDQLKQGFDAKGMKLPPYSNPYARKKGVSRTPKTLNAKGGFYSSFYVLAFDKFIEVGSKDWKAGFLENSEKILGDSKGEVFGLNEENLTELRNLFYPIYSKNLINAILA